MAKWVTANYYFLWLVKVDDDIYLNTTQVITELRKGTENFYLTF